MIQNNLSIVIFGLQIRRVGYTDLIQLVKNSIFSKEQIALTGINVSTLNLVYNSSKELTIFSSFDILHSDGIGIYLASKFLQDSALNRRITGSDFYNELIIEILKNKWKMFFFGDLDSTLNKVKERNPDMNISGIQNGFDYVTEDLIKKINTNGADILVVGLGAPKQERWIFKNRNRIEVPVIISVGEGIRVFAGTKIRGNKMIRQLGLEWFVRLINNPKYFWKRYLLGIPLFIFRFIRKEVMKQYVC